MSDTIKMTIPDDEIDNAFKQPRGINKYFSFVRATREFFEDEPHGWDTYFYKMLPPNYIMLEYHGKKATVFDKRDIECAFDLLDNTPFPGGRFDHFYINVDENAQTFRISHHYGYDY